MPKSNDELELTFRPSGFGLTIDGAGSAILPGSKGYVRVPYPCNIKGWTILGDQAGSIVVDVKKCAYAGFPVTASIAGAEKPTLVAAQKGQLLTLTLWTIALLAGDIIEFVVDSATTVTRVNLAVHVEKT